MRDKNRQNGVAMDEITIRAARLEDAGPIARLDVETWQATYAGILATPYLVGLSPERRAIGWANVIRREPLPLKNLTALSVNRTAMGQSAAAVIRAI